MRSTIAVSTVALMIAGCTNPAIGPGNEATGSSTAPIVGGSRDDGDHAVVAIVAESSRGSSLCTGTLIAPRVVLTAAHCVAPSEARPDATFRAFAGSSLASAGEDDWLPVSAIDYDRDFDGDHPEDGHDIGVVILARPTNIRPIPPNRARLDEALLGEDARVVGFGISNASANRGAGLKRDATMKLIGLSERLLKIGDPWSNLCRGDSGGPALMWIGGQERIVGIASYASKACEGGSYSTRVDAYAAFIDDYL